MSGLITVAAVRFWSCGSEPRAPPSVWRCLWTVTLKPLHRRDEKKTTPEIVMEDAFFKYSTADWHSSWCRLRWVYKTCLIFFLLSLVFIGYLPRHGYTPTETLMLNHSEVCVHQSYIINYTQPHTHRHTHIHQLSYLERTALRQCMITSV